MRRARRPQHGYGSGRKANPTGPGALRRQALAVERTRCAEVRREERVGDGAFLLSLDVALQAEPGPSPPHPSAEHRITNSAAYDAALRQRGSLTVWFTDEAIAAWREEPRTARGRQPWYSPLATLTALTLRAVFRLAPCQTEELIGFIMHLLGLAMAVPDHSTLSRRAETLAVPRPRGNGEPLHLLMDSTGLTLCDAGEWLVEKHGTRTRRSWRNLHLGLEKPVVS